MAMLSLQVNFNGKDQLTPQIKNLLSVSEKLSSKFKDIQQTSTKLAQQQMLMTYFAKQKKALQEQEQAWQQATQKIKRLKEEMAKSPNGGTIQQQRELRKAVYEATRLKQQFQETSKTLQHTRNELSKADISVKNLANAQRKLNTEVNKNKELQDKIIDSMKRAQKQQERLNALTSKLNHIKSVAWDIAQKTIAIGGALAIPTKQAINFETSMLGVAKQMEGARDSTGNLTKDFYAMQDQILKMSTTMPIATNEFAQMVGMSLKMGIAKQDVLGFAQEVVKMGTAFELPTEQLAESMGKIATMYKIATKDIGQLADTINYLDDNALSSGADIIDFMQRVGGTASMIKISDKNVAALGSTFLSLGEKSETAATATNALFSKLGAANTQAKPFILMLKELGLTSAEIEKGMQTDAIATIDKVFNRIKQLPEIAKAGQTSQIDAVATLFGNEHWDSISKLMKNKQEYNRQLQLANSTDATGSMDREFSARMQTSQAQLDVFKNKISTLGIQIGTTLLPVFNNILQKVGDLATRFSDWGNQHPTLMSNITKIIAVVATLVAGFSALAIVLTTILGPFAFLKMTLSSFATTSTRIVGILSKFTPILTQLKGGILGIGKAFLVAGRFMMANPMVLAITAVVAIIAGAAYLIYKHWDTIKAKASELWNTVKNAFNTGINYIKGIIQTVDGVFANNPILNILLPFISIPRMIIANWDSISTFFSTLWQTVTTLLSTAWDNIKMIVLTKAQSIWTWLIDSIYTLKTMIMQKWEEIRQRIGAVWDNIKNTVSTAWNNLLLIFESNPILNKIKNQFGLVLDYLSGLKDRFLETGKNIINGLIEGIEKGFERLKNLWAKINSYMPNFTEKTMKINSPSRLFKSYGQYIMQGLNLGINKGYSALKQQYQKVLSIFTPPQAHAILNTGQTHPLINPIMRHQQQKLQDNIPAILKNSKYSDKIIQIAQKAQNIIDKSKQASKKIIHEMLPNTVKSIAQTIEGDTITINITTNGDNAHSIRQQIEQLLQQRDRQKQARLRDSYIDIN